MDHVISHEWYYWINLKSFLMENLTLAMPESHYHFISVDELVRTILVLAICSLVSYLDYNFINLTFAYSCVDFELIFYCLRLEKWTRPLLELKRITSIWTASLLIMAHAINWQIWGSTSIQWDGYILLTMLMHWSIYCTR